MSLVCMMRWNAFVIFYEKGFTDENQSGICIYQSLYRKSCIVLIDLPLFFSAMIEFENSLRSY